jgi:5-formyltetrahydrofolate cyclo-ligase
MNIEKAALRKKIIQQTDALPADYLKESDKRIFEIIKEMPEFKSAQTIFSYYSLGWEPDTIKLMEYALRQGKTVALPVCFKGGIMEARAVGSLSELSESWYHLLEPLDSTRVIPPEALDFIIVPALAFDQKGYRLGRGGGYYDRFLMKTQAFTAGVTRERLMAGMLPRDAHDIPVQCVVTEERARLTRSLA